jgi:hypothetical protein
MQMRYWIICHSRVDGNPGIPLCNLFKVTDTVFFFDDAQLPGVARRLVTFFVSPKKVTQKRRRQAAALRVPSAAPQKMGSERNSLCSDNVHFFIHFLQRIAGSVTADYFSRLACGIGRGVADVLLQESLWLALDLPACAVFRAGHVE